MGADDQEIGPLLAGQASQQTVDPPTPNVFMNYGCCQALVYVSGLQ